MKQKYQICTNCVMDTSDSRIKFDENGICDHCNDFYNNTLPNWHTDERGKKQLDEIVAKIKKEGEGKEYDSILGMSGGVDSSYMLHFAVKELGLRPLVFHVDGGWNTELSKKNIDCMTSKLNLDLKIEVIDWEDMKDFQLAFFKAGVPHIDIPQDHAFIATLYNYADKNNIKYIINGGNISTEGIRNPLEWLYYGTDMRQINDIRKQFCTRPLKRYPFSPILRHKVYLKYIRKIEVVKLLNYIPYDKAKEVEMLQREYGWTPYPQKHFESIFTRFAEGYWLPKRFGFDTRRVQFSSLIVTNQMKREDAIEQLKSPALSPEEAKIEFDRVASMLDITSEELKGYFDMPLKSYKDYKNQENFFNFGAKVLKALGVEKSIKR